MRKLECYDCGALWEAHQLTDIDGTGRLVCDECNGPERGAEAMQKAMKAGHLKCIGAHDLCHITPWGCPYCEWVEDKVPDPDAAYDRMRDEGR